MRLGRTLRGAWWRRDLNLGLALVVAVAIAATAAAPTFAGAATSALVRERVTAADPLDTDVSWAIGVEDPERDLTAAVETARHLTDDADGLFDPTAVSASALAAWPDARPEAPIVLAWREDQCAEVLVTGACPEAPGEVLLPAGSPTARDYPAGSTLRLRQPPPGGGAGRSSTVELTVVGTWVPQDLGPDGWYDPSRWSAGGDVPTLPACDAEPYSEDISASVGPMLTELSTLRGLADVTVHADAALKPTSDVEQVHRADATADQWQADHTPTMLGSATCVAPVSESDIDGVAGPIDEERSRLRSQGVGAAAGAVLVGILAVVLIATMSARRRRQELALLKLRGVRGPRLAREAVAEPLVLVALGTAVGVPMGWAVGALAARSWLDTAVATPLPTSAWLYAGAVAGLAAVGTVVGTWRTLREPVHRQLRPDRRRTTSTAAVLGRVAVFVLAAVGIYQLRHDDTGEPAWWALSVPVVVGLAGGVVAGWLIHLAARSLLASSRARPGNGRYLGSRRLVRDGELMTVVPFAMAAIVLVVVAGGAWATSAQWRESIALLRTGGPIVADSNLEATTTYAATQRADPDGRWLMTALSFPDESGRVYRRLFVDTTRWDRVVGPALAATPTDTPSDVSAETLTALRERVGDADRRYRGTRMATVLDSDLSWFGSSRRASLLVGVTALDGSEHVVSFPLGRQAVTGPTAPAPFCAAGCTVDSLRVRVLGTYSSAVTGRLGIEELRLGSVELLDIDWRVHPAMRRLVSFTRDPDAGLVIRAHGGSISLRPPPEKEPAVPVVVAGGLDLDDPAVALEPGSALGIDGRPRPARVVGEVESLPLIGDEGVLGDLSTFLADLPSVPPLAEVVVVMRTDTPAPVLGAIRSAGVELDQTRSIEANQRLLDQDPYAQGLRFFWLVAASVAVIAAGTVGTALVGQRRNRAHEGASLRVVGLRRRHLRAAVAFEVGTLGVLIAGCGWLGSWLGSWASLPVLPLGRPGAFEPAPEASTSWDMGLLPAVVAAVVVSVAALGVLVPMTVRARPASLRTGGD